MMYIRATESTISRTVGKIVYIETTRTRISYSDLW